MWRLCNMAVTLTNVICEDIDFGVIPDSKVHGANMGPIWGRQDPGGPHVGPMNFAIWDALRVYHDSVMWIFCVCLIKLSFSWKSFVFKFLRFCTVVLISDVCYRRSHDTYRVLRMINKTSSGEQRWDIWYWSCFHGNHCLSYFSSFILSACYSNITMSSEYTDYWMFLYMMTTLKPWHARAISISRCNLMNIKISMINK